MRLAMARDQERSGYQGFVLIYCLNMLTRFADMPTKNPQQQKIMRFQTRWKRASNSRRMRDHAGQPTTSFNPSIIGIGKNAGTGGMSRGSYRSFIREMRRRHAQPIGTRCIGVMLLILILLIAPLAIMDFLEYGLTLDTLRQFVSVFAFALFVLFAFTTHGLPHEIMVKELLARSHCASCGFDLAGVCVDREGLRSCPECGCRWRIASPDQAA